MPNIVEELIKIEQEAKILTANTKNEQLELHKKIKERKLVIKNNFDLFKSSKTSEISQEAKEEANNLINQITSQTKQKLTDLEIEFNNNKEKWIDEIFVKIIT